MLALHMWIPRISIHSDSLIVVNAVNGKLAIPRDNIDIVEDIRITLRNFEKYRVDYCSGNLNTEADALAKRALMI